MEWWQLSNTANTTLVFNEVEGEWLCVQSNGALDRFYTKWIEWIGAV